jgi:hypothetical protein
MTNSGEIDWDEENLQRMFTNQSDQIDSLIEAEQKNLKSNQQKEKEKEKDKRKQQKKSRQKNRRK